MMKDWDKTYQEIMEIMQTEITKISQEFIGQPNTIEQQERIRERMIRLAHSLGGHVDILDSMHYAVNIDDLTGLVSVDTKSEYECVDKDNLHVYLDKLVDKAQERVIEYIQDHYDKYDIQEYQEYMYQIITDKSYDIIIALLDEDYYIEDEDFDFIVEQVQGELDFAEFYEVVDDILHTAMTTEEKLAEVGMSYRDFL